MITTQRHKMICAFHASGTAGFIPRVDFLEATEEEMAGWCRTQRSVIIHL